MNDLVEFDYRVYIIDNIRVYKEKEMEMIHYKKLSHFLQKSKNIN